MTVQTRPTAAWETAHAAFAAERRDAAPDWIREIRARGLARFTEIGFPGKSDEEWRFTNVTPIAEGDFRLATSDHGPAGTAVDAAALEPFDFPGLPGPLLVFVDGRFSAGLSRVGDLPDGVTVTTLREAAGTTPDLVRPHLGRLASPEGEPFSALNAAFLDDGIFVHVKRGVRWAGPVRMLTVATAGSEPFMTHLRNLVVLEDDSEVSVVEDRVSLGEGCSFTNVVTEVIVGANARAHHTVLERQNHASFAVSTVHSDQGRSSAFEAHSALLGGALVRSEIHPQLNGEGADCLLNGFYVPNGSQHHDTNMVVHHAKPHGESRQFYRGILDGKAHAVFSGRIVVYEDAQKTDAVQSDMNLLLSADAVIDTKPQLEIYADDVKCTHGATVGQLDADAIFYMKARGIPEEEARGLLVFAFVNEVLDRMNLVPIREGLATLLAGRLPGSRG